MDSESSEAPTPVRRASSTVVESVLHTGGDDSVAAQSEGDPLDDVLPEVVNQYHLRQELGRGAFARVRRAFVLSDAGRQEFVRCLRGGAAGTKGRTEQRRAD